MQLHEILSALAERSIERGLKEGVMEVQLQVNKQYVFLSELVELLTNTAFDKSKIRFTENYHLRSYVDGLHKTATPFNWNTEMPDDEIRETTAKHFYYLNGIFNNQKKGTLISPYKNITNASRNKQKIEEALRHFICLLAFKFTKSDFIEHVFISVIHDKLANLEQHLREETALAMDKILPVLKEHNLTGIPERMMWEVVDYAINSAWDNEEYNAMVKEYDPNLPIHSHTFVKFMQYIINSCYSTPGIVPVKSICTFRYLLTCYGLVDYKTAPTAS